MKYHSSKQLSLKYGFWVCALAAMFYCYEYLLRVSPSVMMPDLMRATDASATTLGWIVALYYYAYTPAQLPVGLILDRVGPRRVLSLATLLCAGGAILFAAYPHLWSMGLARFCIGLGSAFAFVGVLKLASVWLPESYFAIVAGMTTALGMLGAIFGEMVMSLWVKECGWSASMWSAGLIGFMLLPCMWWVIRDRPAHLVAEKTEKVTWTALKRDVCLVLGHHQIWLAGLIGALMFLPTIVFAELWGIECLKVVRGLTAHEASTVTAAIFLGWAVGGPCMGLCSDRFAVRKLPILIGSWMATALMLIILYYPTLSLAALQGLSFIFGFFSASQNIVFAIARDNIPLRLAGTAAATTNFIIMLGGMIFQPFVGQVLDWLWDGHLEQGLPVYTAQGYQWALSILPIGLLLTSVVLYSVRETHGKLCATA